MNNFQSFMWPSYLELVCQTEPDLFIKTLMKYIYTEAFTHLCSVNKMFLQNLQNSKENTCVRALF